MWATIDTMYLNEKIIRIYLFCPFLPLNTRQMHFKWSIVTKSSHPFWPPKYHTVGARYINAQKSKKQFAQIRNGQI